MLQSENSIIFIVMLKCCRSDSYNLSLSHPAELHILNLAVPNLVWAINDSDFARIVIKSDQLYHLNEEIKVIIFSGFGILCAFLRNFCKRSDILGGNDMMLCKWFLNPISIRLNQFFLARFKAKLATEELERLELSLGTSQLLLIWLLFIVCFLFFFKQWYILLLWL